MEIPRFNSFFFSLLKKPWTETAVTLVRQWRENKRNVAQLHKNYYYMSTEIYSKQSCQIKMVCQNLETI